MDKAIANPLVTTIAFLGMVTVNALANILPINGLNTGEVSDLYPSMFTPAGLTFSIWSVIYFLLGVFVVFTWNRSDKTEIQNILPWFFLSCVLNIAWIIVWHYLLPGISVLVMISLLTVLAIIFRKVQAAKNIEDSGFYKVWVVLPFTLYLSWICVATIANIATLLVFFDWHGGFLSESTWTIVMMSIAALLALKITIDFKVPFFALVVIWALLGIYLRWKGSEHLSIIYSAVILMLILSGVVLYAWRRNASRVKF